MPVEYVYTFISVFVVSLISLIGIIALSCGERLLRNLLLVLVSLAAGALLGDAFIHLIPEALNKSSSETGASVLIIAGILLFFLIEKILHWHRSHGEEDIEEFGNMNEPLKHGKDIHPTGYIVLISDGMHNILDGIIIGASFMAGPELGIATTLAIMLHEIPQEIGDFGVLLHTGFTRAKALFLNFVSALFAFLGAAISLFLGNASESLIIWIIPIAAGGFIYIAATDLLPELQKTKEVKHSIVQFSALLAGVAAMLLLLFIET
jgi:zinc and cadmium transporter